MKTSKYELHDGKYVVYSELRETGQDPRDENYECKWYRETYACETLKEAREMAKTNNGYLGTR